MSRNKVDVLGHPKHWTSVCSFNVKGAHPLMSERFLINGFAVRTGHHCAMPTMEHFGLSGTARASVAFYNSVDEVDRFLEALDRVIGMLTLMIPFAALDKAPTDRPRECDGETSPSRDPLDHRYWRDSHGHPGLEIP